MRPRLSFAVAVLVATAALAADSPNGNKPGGAKPAGELLVPVVVNGSFEEAPKAGSLMPPCWGFFSRTQEGSASLSEDARQGKGAGHVVHTGAKDWAFSNGTRIPARPGQQFLATCWVKGTGRPTLAIVAYSKGELVTWEAGSAFIGAGPAWGRLEAEAVVPEGADEVRVRLTGTGKTDLLVDDVGLQTGVYRKKIEKPLVGGGAKQRVTEKLDRGLVAVPAAGGNGVYLSWRVLETDPAGLRFDVYRAGADGAWTKVTQAPVTATADFVDAGGKAGDRYEVRAAAQAADVALVTGAATAAAQQYLSIKLDDGETAQKIGIADLDGDGKPDFVLKTPNSNVDPYEKYWKRSPGTYRLRAFRHDGTPLWTHDLGWAIEQGIWYSPYVVYDFDGDGRAEVAAKVGPPGDPRDAEGKVTSGEESVAILDGRTGKEITRAPWPGREGFPSYNYYSRNQLAVAYLDGKTPCLLVERGTYNTIKIDAYELSGGKLVPLWKWEDSEDGPAYRGQGAHCLRAADIDGDGRDEVLVGSAVLDDNGTGLWSTRQGHPDQMCVGDLDPARPGLEIAYGLEVRQKKNGVCMVDARTGKVLWGLDRPSIHIHGQGLSSDIDPRHPGVEVYGGERDDKEKRYLYTAQGKLLSDNKDLGGLAPRGAYWDASPQRELMTRNQFVTFDGKTLEPKIEGGFVAAADLLGDWREEVVTTLPGELRIYVTNLPAGDRRVTLLRDPIYRNDIATATQGYYQLPSLSKLPGFDGPAASAGAAKSAP